MANIRVTCFRATRAGFYEHGHHEPVFGSYVELLEDVHHWANTPGLLVSNTATFSVEEGDDEEATENKHLPVYCYESVRDEDTGDALLTLWNETEHADGEVAGVHGNQAVGDAEVEVQQFEEDSIPGYPTYFWFCPEHSLVAAVQEIGRYRLIGREGMHRYLTGFLSLFSQWAIINEDDDTEIVGYGVNGEEHPRAVRPYFRSNPVDRPGQIEIIKRRRADIRKIIRKSEFPNLRPNQDNVFRSFLGSFFIPDQIDHPLVTDRYKIEMDYRPSRAELDDMIDSWQQEDFDGWNDLGFVMSGEQTPRWVSHSRARRDILIDFDRKNSTVIDAQSLLGGLTAFKNELLALGNAGG